jgi:hypothetical protein
VLRDWRIVAVKVQYPGVDHAIRATSTTPSCCYRFFSTFTLRGLDVKGLVDELPATHGDELDYRLERKNQARVRPSLYHDHPFIKIPEVVPELSTTRVLTDRVGPGLDMGRFELSATSARQADGRRDPVPLRPGLDPPSRQCSTAIRIPGNYRSSPTARCTFLDFRTGQAMDRRRMELLAPCLRRHRREPRSPALMRAMEASGFLPPRHRPRSAAASTATSPVRTGPI